MIRRGALLPVCIYLADKPNDGRKIRKRKTPRFPADKRQVGQNLGYPALNTENVPRHQSNDQYFVITFCKLRSENSKHITLKQIVLYFFVK